MSLTLTYPHLVYVHICTFIYAMHRVVPGAKIPLIGRNQSFYSTLQEESHTPLTKSTPGSVCTWAPEQGSDASDVSQ